MYFQSAGIHLKERNMGYGVSYSRLKGIDRYDMIRPSGAVSQQLGGRQSYISCYIKMRTKYFCLEFHTRPFSYDRTGGGGELRTANFDY